MDRVFKAAGVFALWWVFRGHINIWQANIRFLANALGIGLPVCLLLEPLFSHLSAYIKLRWDENSKMRLFHRQMDYMSGGTSNRREYQNPFNVESMINNSACQNEAPQPVYEDPPSLLTPAQIEQLNKLRQKVSLTTASSFPMIRLAGKSMPNLVPEAGMFTARIERNGELQNLVVMLATMQAVSEFARLCAMYGSLPKDFWAEGHLLPSRTGVCYSVLFATSFRLCGKLITF